jgi:hypothetical protein
MPLLEESNRWDRPLFQVKLPDGFLRVEPMLDHFDQGTLVTARVRPLDGIAPKDHPAGAISNDRLCQLQ